MSHPNRQDPPGGAFFPVDPTMLPAVPLPFQNPHVPFPPPGLNLFPPPPPQLQQDHLDGMAPQTQPKRKGKKKKKKGQNAPDAPLPKAKSSQQQQQQQQQQQRQRQRPRGAGNGAPALPDAQSQLAFPAQQMFAAQHAFYGQQGAQAPLPHEQQFMGHLQALIHAQQHLQPPADPAMPPVPGPSSGKGPAKKGPPTGPKAKQHPPPTGPKAKSKPHPKRVSPGPNRDGRRAPSKASGGVPNASHTYLSTARLPPFLSPQPRPLLVIIDLNGTLIHRPSRRTNPTNFQARPHASPFLHYVITTFTTMIWSSAKPENVRSVTDRLLDPADRASLLAVWGREAFGFTDRDYNDRVQCYKRLSRAWEDPAVRDSHPMGQVWDQTNTVLIDDSAEKARSEPYNLVQIPEFAGGAEAEDDILPQVHTYLNTLSMQGDVSRYMQASPFRPQEKFVMS